MFTKRLISALVLLAVMGTALAVGGTLLLCLSVITALLGSFELLRVDHMQKSYWFLSVIILAAGGFG